MATTKTKKQAKINYSTKAIIVNDNLDMIATESNLRGHKYNNEEDLIEAYRDNLENIFSENNQGIQSLILEIESESNSVTRRKFNKIWDILSE